jgi:hypothetical protein
MKLKLGVMVTHLAKLKAAGEAMLGLIPGEK